MRLYLISFCTVRRPTDNITYIYIQTIKTNHLLTLPFLSIAGTKHQVVAYTERSQIKHENRHIQLVREYGFHPRTKASVEDGALLPRKFEPFPQNMYGRPLEEIDTFIYEEVSPAFCL